MIEGGGRKVRKRCATPATQIKMKLQMDSQKLKPLSGALGQVLTAPTATTTISMRMARGACNFWWFNVIFYCSFGWVQLIYAPRKKKSKKSNNLKKSNIIQELIHQSYKSFLLWNCYWFKLEHSETIFNLWFHSAQNWVYPKQCEMPWQNELI